MVYAPDVDDPSTHVQVRCCCWQAGHCSALCKCALSRWGGYCAATDQALLHCPAQVAIVSWSGESCGTATNPDVDTKVAAFYDWISQAINEVEAGG